MCIDKTRHTNATMTNRNATCAKTKTSAQANGEAMRVGKGESSGKEKPHNTIMNAKKLCGCFHWPQTLQTCIYETSRVIACYVRSQHQVFKNRRIRPVQEMPIRTQPWQSTITFLASSIRHCCCRAGSQSEHDWRHIAQRDMAIAEQLPATAL